ncbi:helix-turn-helix transcriptional regulator [Frankia sp. AgB1.9]|uniref:winged helix-turn-helix transcriptional regulator n=1 Tax=unclassified Frankia TaxID=2632575 RepID=UPI001932BD07|nr:MULTISPECIES: helix-turn-helix domain-containing protein [unclassified Frankia]MBL7492057.1 helix-turn-helix transcriptional regulator [Frankia sp. AgW1.1]MBL7550804.1 helix-turn-helix transcriptional regulator [Frankia sp. AgB1.9]MBL7625094.1 helix-turn-helix transcriptional regulator [Frankia sp. AgB1.8]
MAQNGRECSIANALAVVGERWALLALREINLGVTKFDQIARNTGASRDILAARLRALVAAGVVERRQYQDHPPRFEYVATESGVALRPVLHALMAWGDQYATEGEPPTVLAHECGAELRTQTVCAHCGGRVAWGENTRTLRLGAVR